MARFIDLPTELMLDVFIQLASFTDAVHLASATRTTWSIWQNCSNAQVILDAVGPRCIEHLPEARRLLQSQLPTLHERDDVHKVIEGLHCNSRRLAVNIDAFEKHGISRWVNPQRNMWRHPGPHLTITERSRFIPAWYNMWTCVYETDCQSTLDTITLRALHWVKDVLLSLLDQVSADDCADPEVEKHLTGRLNELFYTFDAALDEKSMRLLGGPCVIPAINEQGSGQYAILDGFQWAMNEVPDLA